MIVGMDFGTTNSGMSVYDGQELRILPLDAASDNPRVFRTALYITNEQEVVVGREALDQYFAQNVGRPVKLKKVWVGEIEVIASEMYYVQDTYVWTDVLSPGRLFLSFKTNLRDHEYVGTVVGQNFFPIESLVALYLTVAKKRAEAMLGRELKEVVLGRPVHFATNREHDNLAQERLLRGAFQAGYERVYLQYEPIAAAYDYAGRAHGPQNILVFDFGGGTLDLTVMRFENGRRKVLATGGVPIAGDVFDQKLVRAKLPKHFGEGATYGSRKMPSPQWIYDLFSSWQTILELQTPKNVRVLRDLAYQSSRPGEIKALISLVSGNHSLRMFDTVEQTKRDLSNRFGAMIQFSGPDFRVLELVTRQEFENIIRHEVIAIEQELDNTLVASGLAQADIDAVIRTGGSAQIPIFQQMLHQKFGAEKVLALDTFSSVTAGLGIIAHGIAAGDIAADPITPADLTRSPVKEPARRRPNVKPVNLDLIQRRIAAEESGETVQADRERALVLLATDSRLHYLMTPQEALSRPEPLDLSGRLDAQDQIPSLRSLVLADLDDTLLLITSKYRFLLHTVRQLIDGQALGLQLADLYHFRENEVVFALAHWDHLKAGKKLIMVTSLGYARAFPTPVMVESIESPVPWGFDYPLPGWPVAVLPAQGDEQVVMVTDYGRGIRIPVAEVPGRGLQVLNRPDSETVNNALLARPEQEILLVTETGYARRMRAEWVYAAQKTNDKGKVLVSRRPVHGTANIEFGRPVWLLTNERLVPVDPAGVWGEDDSTKTYKLRGIRKGERVRSLVR
jgi:hypothetical chaperone protein